jgi:hypothetical protein
LAGHAHDSFERWLEDQQSVAVVDGWQLAPVRLDLFDSGVPRTDRRSSLKCIVWRGWPRAAIAWFLLPLAAGNFVCIAASDPIAEAHRAQDLRQALRSLAAFIGGLTRLYGLAVVEAAG